MTAHEHYEELVAAYALDALDRDARSEVERHLAECETCRDTLRDLTRVSASIGLGVEPVAPPPSLRARVVEAARGSADAGAVSRRPAPPVATGAWRGALATAASLAAAVGLGLYSLSLRSQLDSTREMLAEALDRVVELRREVAETRREATRLTNTVNVLRSGDVVRVDLTGEGPGAGASGRAYVSAARGMFFTAERLPGLAANRSYQLWVIPEGAGAAPISAGVFSVDQAGNSLLSMDLPAGVSTVAAVAVTEEPAGGSVKATTAPLLIGRAVNN